MTKAFRNALTLLKTYNRNTLAITEGKCQYLTEDGKRCIIGAMLTYPSLTTFKDSNERATVIMKHGARLRSEYQGLSTTQITQLQEFHDNVNNFTNEGLSEKGKASFELLKFIK